MFNQSYQQLSFHQQVITLSQTYPCPRCTCGLLEPYGYTETLQCNGCERLFVALRGSRLLHPANQIGWRIAPIFWWDGLRWHFAGTTATVKQWLTLVLTFLTPIVGSYLALATNIWRDRPEWCSSLLLCALVGLITIQLIYLLCWDFDFLSKRRIVH